MTKFSKISGLYGLILALIWGAMASVGGYAETPPPAKVSFQVMAQQDVTANAIEIQLKLEGKGSSIDTATQRVNQLANQIQTIAKVNGVSDSDVQIQRTITGTSSWLFGQDYSVTSIAKVTLRNFDNWTRIAKALTQANSAITFLNIQYQYPQTPEVWNKLATTAYTDATARKTRYEELMKTKLKLVDIHETQSRPYAGPVAMSLKSGVEAAQMDGAADANEPVPVQNYQLVLDLTFTSI